MRDHNFSAMPPPDWLGEAACVSCVRSDRNIETHCR